MKRQIFFLALMLPGFLGINAQKNAIDNLFEKYSETEGVTTVYISGKMLNMFSGLNEDNVEAKGVMNKLTSIMILSVDDSLLNAKINFYKELGSNMNYKDYEELMVVREGTSVVKFLIKESGTRITELLMVTGGNSNTLISIRGDIDLKSISSISKSMDIEGLENLEKVEKKEIKK